MVADIIPDTDANDSRESGMAKQRIVTLLTDFGSGGPYVAEMKGVILTLMPQATLVDISHSIPPGDILSGAFVLAQAVGHFPPGTVHAVVVDPGVGTRRRVLAARYASQVVVFPDNGMISAVNDLLPMEEIVVVADERHFLGKGLNSTFQGRDVIAPVAARVVGGMLLKALGPPPETFKVLDLPQPRVLEDGSVMGEVIFVDAFGNLISNISATVLAENFGEALDLDVASGGQPVGPLQPAYGFVGPGEPLALINSMELLEVAVNGGRASERFNADVGCQVQVGRRKPGE